MDGYNAEGDHLPIPVEDTPEVAEARAAFMAYMIEWMAMMARTGEQDHEVLPVINVGSGSEDGAGDFEVVEAAPRSKRAPESEPEPEARHGYYQEEEMDANADQLALPSFHPYMKKDMKQESRSYPSPFQPMRFASPMPTQYVYQPYVNYPAFQYSFQQSAAAVGTKGQEKKQEQMSYSHPVYQPFQYQYQYPAFSPKFAHKSAMKTESNMHKQQPYQAVNFAIKPYGANSAVPFKTVNYYMEKEEQEDTMKMPEQQQQAVPFQYTFIPYYQVPQQKSHHQQQVYSHFQAMTYDAQPEKKPLMEEGLDKPTKFTKKFMPTYMLGELEDAEEEDDGDYEELVVEERNQPDTEYVFSPTPAKTNKVAANIPYYSMPTAKQQHSSSHAQTYNAQMGFSPFVSSYYPTIYPTTPVRFFRRPAPVVAPVSAVSSVRQQQQQVNSHSGMYDSSVPNIPEVDQPAAEVY